MKIILSLILVGILCFILVITLTKKVITDDVISLIVKESSLTNSGAIFILENHTDTIYHYGTNYSIQKERFGIWFTLRPKNQPVFILMKYHLEAKESREIKIDWEYNYGKLTSGRYRFIKTMNPNSDSFLVGAEFIIE